MRRMTTKEIVIGLIILVIAILAAIYYPTPLCGAYGLMAFVTPPKSEQQIASEEMQRQQITGCVVLFVIVTALLVGGLAYLAYYNTVGGG